MFRSLGTLLTELFAYHDFRSVARHIREVPSKMPLGAFFEGIVAYTCVVDSFASANADGLKN